MVEVQLYFVDLTDYIYRANIDICRADEVVNRSVPVVNIGWLDPGYSFPSGAARGLLIETLRRLCMVDLTNETRGVHFCGFCKEATTREGLLRGEVPFGNGEIRVAGAGVIYAAPQLVAHYVEAHGYLPPEEFLTAVLELAGHRELGASTLDQ